MKTNKVEKKVFPAYPVWGDAEFSIGEAKYQWETLTADGMTRSQCCEDSSPSPDSSPLFKDPDSDSCT